MQPEPKLAGRRRRPALVLYLIFGGIMLFVAFATWTAMQETSAAEQGVVRVSLPRTGPPPGRMQEAPDFTFTLFDGRQLTLSELRGSGVVLNFWASWCPPCRAEARDLERTWQAYRDRGVVFLGVDIQDTEKDARSFLREFGVTYPNGQDVTGNITTSYGLTGIPETFLITREGKVARHWIGPIGQKQLAALIEELLLTR